VVAGAVAAVAAWVLEEDVPCVCGMDNVSVGGMMLGRGWAGCRLYGLRSRDGDRARRTQPAWHEAKEEQNEVQPEILHAGLDVDDGGGAEDGEHGEQSVGGAAVAAVVGGVGEGGTVRAGVGGGWAAAG
jgi:hypothetical protein